MEITSRFHAGHSQPLAGRISWWSGLMHKHVPLHLLEMPQPNPRGISTSSAAADDDWDHLWTDLGGEG
jgi:hypothetical protein